MTQLNSNINPVKFDIYQMVTDTIIEAIEKGVSPWTKPWKTVKGLDNLEVNTPINFVTRKPYNGINALLLACSGYDVPYFITFNQVQKLKGSINKGAKSLPVVFWEKNQYTSVNEDTGEIETHDGFILKYFRVFNISDTNINYKFEVIEKPLIEGKNRTITVCDEFIRNNKNVPRIVFTDRSRCFYSPSRDIINMVRLANFSTSNHYYSTLFHEIIHSTGHKNRLCREEIANLQPFGTISYSKEELTAEIGSAFLNNILGIATPDILTNTASYLKGWLVPLKNDKKFIFDAAKKAEKAVKFLLGEIQ